MADVQKYFEQFHNKIRVDFDMSEKLREKRNIIVDRLRKHLLENNRPNFEEFLQGSYKMKTGSKPIADLEYDIDVGLRFSSTKTTTAPKPCTIGFMKPLTDILKMLKIVDRVFA